MYASTASDQFKMTRLTTVQKFANTKTSKYVTLDKTHGGIIAKLLLGAMQAQEENLAKEIK